MKTLSGSNVLLCGLAFTSRTETLEEYLKDKTSSLTVIALSGCFLKENLSSCRVYEAGILKTEFKIPIFRIKDYKWYRQPLLPLVFFVYWVSICFSLLRLRKKYDIYIGISHSFALWGAILKKLKIVESLIYYCIDYYLPPKKTSLSALFIKLLNKIDPFTVKSSDYIWDLSPNISAYRCEIGKIKIGSYKNAIVPLGYSAALRRFQPIEAVNQQEIGFVGSITANQGLELLAEAMPEIIKRIAGVKVTIIGQGTYSEDLKALVAKKGLNPYFSFTGFIKDENKMLDMLSRCSVALALYTETSRNNNIICADPGKTKLYAFCGLPIITTHHCSLAEEIASKRAGVVINYDKHELTQAVLKLLSDSSVLREYKENSFALGESFISDRIFDSALQKFFQDN